jgi:hypothetical protein
MDEVLEMKTRIERLETEKIETRELREKYDREMEHSEDQWQKEVQQIKSFLFHFFCSSIRKKI